MQSGEYIANRLLPKAIRDVCARHNITCTGFSDDWVLKLARGEQTAWISGYKFDINAAAASHLAQDKVATYEVLKAAGVQALPHVLVRSVPGEPIARQRLQQALGAGDVVIKPLNGTGGRGVQRFAALDDAFRAIEQSTEPAWAVSPFVDVMSETRLVVLDGRVLLAYEKQNPQEAFGLKFYNLSHGARAADIADADIPKHMRELAMATCRELGLRLAAVDVITITGGEQLVLEVNDGFSMEYYARHSADYKKRAVELYDAIVNAMFPQ